MSFDPATRARLRLGLARLLHVEPGLLAFVGEPRAGAERSCEWLCCLPAARLACLAAGAGAPPPAAAKSWTELPEALLAGCNTKLKEILEEVLLDPHGCRAFCGPLEQLEAGGGCDANSIVADFRTVAIPPAQQEESSACRKQRRLAVLCVAVGQVPQGAEQVLRVQRRLGQVHCILSELLLHETEVAKADVAPAVQPGACLVPSTSFCLEMMDHEPFGTRGMQEAFPAAMLAKLFLPPGGTLPCGVYCARLQRHQGFGVLLAVNQHHDTSGQASSELCVFRCRGDARLPGFVHCIEQSSALAAGGALEDVRWLRPFYHGYTRLGVEALRELIDADLHAAVGFLWPSPGGAHATPRPSRVPPAVGSGAPLPMHLLAQEVLPYACVAALGAWAPASLLLRREAERCASSALAADTATASGGRGSSVASAVTGRA